MNERLKRLRAIGQSVWVDSLSRDNIQNGTLQRMTEDGVLGVTSNPTILQQAIAQSELYDQELQKLAETTDDAREIFRRIAVRDIRDASDIFMPVYEQTEHKDGYVSLEVSPELAFDTEGTITRAKLLPVPDEYLSLAGSVGHGEEAHRRENESLARLLSWYWHENPRRLARVLDELEIWMNVFPEQLEREDGRS